MSKPKSNKPVCPHCGKPVKAVVVESSITVDDEMVSGSDVLLFKDDREAVIHFKAKDGGF